MLGIFRRFPTFSLLWTGKFSLCQRWTIHFRLAVVVFPHHNIFSRGRVIGLTIGQHILSMIMSYLVQFQLPCCRLCWFVFAHPTNCVRITFIPRVFTYSYLRKEGIFNYAAMVDLPLNSLATITPLISYSVVSQLFSKTQNEESINEGGGRVC